MIALLLAQLVMPSPSVEPLSPPGMVCMGECSDGPMVWRASPARDRLVVACDMTSDTCSDGRKIVTERATPVPCETSPGVWETVPEDEGCYGVRGLESWGANTSYLSWGAELDREPWGSIRGGTLAQVVDGWRVSNDPAQANSGWVYTGGAADEGVTYTVACRVRAETPTTLRVSPLDAGGSDCPLHQVGAEWATVSCTQTAGAGRSERAHIWPGVGQEGPASVIVAACWLTKTSTPGRPCWGGEAPVTCTSDRHTISTEGWPTESGEVVVLYAPGQDEAATRYLVSASSFGTAGWEVYVRNTNTISFLAHNDGATIYSSDPLTWEVRPPHKPYSIRVKWGAGKVKFWRDGVQVGESTMDRIPNSVHSVARIGSRSDSGEANGSIRSLTVRSFE